MSRCLIALGIMLTFAAFTANATPPPAHGGYQAGWGMNPTDWQEASGSFYALGLYNPNYAGGGAAWIVGWNPTTYITYAPITLELWIEMNMVLSYWYTSYQWHRLGNSAETITFTIDGTIASNNSQVIMMSPASGWDLTYLRFIENIGVGDNQNARNLPLAWQVRWGSGTVIGENVVQNWGPPYWLCQNMLVSMSAIPACDHWFQYQGTFSLVYHEVDGYYKLLISGCPYPGM